MRPTGRRGRGAAQPRSGVPSWESLGSWFPREPWVKPRGSKPRLPRARGCQARVWGLPAGVARRGNQTRAVATQQNPLVQPSTHSVTHPSVPQTLAEGLWVPASAVVLRKVAEQAVQGASAAPDPRATSAAVTREAGVPSAVGEAARRVPSLRGAGREAGVGFALGRRRGGPSRHVCSARDSGGVSPTLPRRRASWRAGGCSVEPEATSRRRRSRESGVAEAAARVRGLAPGCGREKRGVGCRGGGLHARRRPSTSP